MSAIKVNLDGLDSSAIQIRTVALTLGDLKSSMNRVFCSIDPKIKRRRNISGSIADIQKEMEMLYTEMNELGSFISSSKSQYANTEARLFQMSSDYTNRFHEMMESANAEENWLELIGYAVIGNAKGLESFLKQAGDLIVNVGSKVISGVEGVAVSSVCNCVEGFANAGFGVAEFFHLVPDTSARYEFKHDLDALQAAIADQYVLDKQWYYGGRAVGDITSSIVGTKIAANGLIAVAAGLVGEGVGAGFTVTGAGAVAGVPAMVVSGAAAAVGALEVAAGLSVSAVSIKNFRDDFSKFQKEGQANGASKSENTRHGDQRLKERGFTDEKVNDLINNYSQKVYQEGGKTVYAKKNGNYYDVIITNADGEIITAVGGNSKSLRTWKDVTRMLNNNGGYSTLPY
ncbi:hypothetical protein [Caproiciproducens galactitolivorans]|uniref:LXG domain-containing protein n=1 Tax=Caproiciproducens galactitolivorans TaxID=642589 RepID=A0ABT4BQA0_9FIRM|nr:hypothetical protein [Caproiciproducens galactitolivorans]MCY1713056.1 hypothetical protein [Caproiciproducens galactitolivorans]